MSPLKLFLRSFTLITANFPVHGVKSTNFSHLSTQASGGGGGSSCKFDHMTVDGCPRWDYQICFKGRCILYKYYTKYEIKHKEESKCTLKLIR